MTQSCEGRSPQSASVPACRRFGHGFSLPCLLRSVRGEGRRTRALTDFRDTKLSFSPLCALPTLQSPNPLFCLRGTPTFRTPFPKRAYRPLGHGLSCRLPTSGTPPYRPWEHAFHAASDTDQATLWTRKSVGYRRFRHLFLGNLSKRQRFFRGNSVFNNSHKHNNGNAAGCSFLKSGTKEGKSQ
jgi:hypothetical protein